jgi:WD40 repeat protein
MHQIDESLNGLGAVVASKIPHTGAVSQAAFSPDGRWVVTGSYDQTARVWEAATGKAVRVG